MLLQHRSRSARIAALFLVGLAVLGEKSQAETTQPLEVVTTTPNLAALIEAVGGSDVRVRSLARPGEDPHFVEARPSFVRLLHSADLLAVVGLDLGAGYIPTLVAQARNSEIQPGRPGYFDASVGVDKIFPARSGVMARALGDVHPLGNPHYLSDPVEGLRVARRLTERLSQIAPRAGPSFEKNYLSFRDKLLSKLYGAEAVKTVGARDLATASFEGPESAARLLASKSVTPAGWELQSRGYSQAAFVADHNLWPYFARRFGLREVALLEPFPGVSPTTRHLQKVIGKMRELDVPLILSSTYFRDQYAKKVARETGARIARMTDQVGVDKNAKSYIEMIEANLNSVTAALARP